MLHVLLLILKIIGILLLGILGLLVLLIAILLFVPIRYKVVGEYNEKGVLQCQVHWLLRMIHLGATVDTKSDPIFKYRIKLFGYTISGTDKKPKEPKKQKNKKTKKNKFIEKPKLLEMETQKAETQKAETQKVETLKTDVDDSIMPEKKETFIIKLKNIWKKVMGFLKSIPGKIQNIKYTIEMMCDKITRWRETYEYYRDLLEGEDAKAVLRLCKKQLQYIGRKLKPQKFQCTVRFGLEDPSTTGQILAIYGMLYPVIGNNVLVQADFERVFIEGDIYIKGKIKLYILIKVAIVLYFNKNIKILLILLKREEIKNGGK